MKKGQFRRRLIVMGVVLGTLLVPAVALVYLERPSDWPDPKPCGKRL